jgi:hypothetical protein
VCGYLPHPQRPSRTDGNPIKLLSLTSLSLLDQTQVGREATIIGGGGEKGGGGGGKEEGMIMRKREEITSFFPVVAF